jgi:hypothetical protein
MAKRGIVSDPWRTPVAEAPAEAAENPFEETANVPDAPAPPSHTGDDIDVDVGARPVGVLSVRNYGGITVIGAPSPTHVAAQVLRFLVDNLKEVDRILTDYGVVVTRLNAHDSIARTPFYVQRQDGWTLAMPAVSSRDAGCVQLIQALLNLQKTPRLKAKMEHLGIRVYRV